MKKLITLATCALLIFINTYAQPKGKQKEKEKAPTQKEMDDMMKEMQKAMDEMSPEDKKAMDSVGIKMPDMKSIQKTVAGISDAQLKKAYEDENRIVPQKDITRIAGISKTPLTNTSLTPFLSAAHTKVVAEIEQESKSKGEEIYQLVKKQYNSAVATGNTAASLLMMGKIELALYVMGKACMDDPANIDNLNNYAAMLSMGGAEQLAIPILEKLNKQFPKNSTLLNNIGQAWFGLGEIAKAEKYLDSTIRMYAYHPQANFTKSFIEESKGNQQGAVDAAKRSIKNAYSQEKENRLNKLKYKLKDDDVNWKFHMPQDPLGLEKFKWPDYPKNVAQSEILEKEWDAFKTSCNDKINELTIKESRLEAEAASAQQKLMQYVLQAGNKGTMVDPLPRFARKAFIRLKYLVDGKDGQLAYSYQKKVEAIANSMIHNATYEKKYVEEIESLTEKYKDKFGEGKSNPFGEACADDTKVKNTYLISVNTSVEQNYTDYLNFLRRKINDEVYYYQYTMWPENFELAKVQAQLSWLNSIKSQGVTFKDKSPWCQDNKEEEKIKPFKLQAFDDVHCEYHSQLSTPVGTIRADCSRLTTTLDLKFVKLGLKQDMDQKTFNDQFMNCTVEVGAGVAVGAKNLGPIKAELSVGGAIAVEIDRTGITDVIVKGAAGISVGTDVINDGSKGDDDVKSGTETKDGSAGDVGVIKDLQIEVGVKGQISIINGKGSVEGTGVLEKGNKK